jgi:hypothetical protein
VCSWQSWVATEQCWNYQSAPFEVTVSEKLYIRLENVDSISSIYLNGNQIGDTFNTFRTFIFPLNSKYLRNDGSNEIKITLWGVTDYIKDKFTRYPYSVPETVNYNVWAEPSHRSLSLINFHFLFLTFFPFQTQKFRS